MQTTKEIKYTVVDDTDISKLSEIDMTSNVIHFGGVQAFYHKVKQDLKYPCKLYKDRYVNGTRINREFIFNIP